MKTKYTRLTIVAALAAAVLAPTLTAKDPAPEYTLHEWGTFTSLAGSDGVLLPGLQREEEALPTFVFSHEGMENLGLAGAYVSKGWRRPLHNVRIKMETPVLYFYAPRAFQASVEVGFEGGSISQWYPQRSGGETPPPTRIEDNAIVGGDIDFAQPHHGSIRWDVQILDPDPLNDRLVFKGPETPTWLYPRMTGSNVVSTALDQYEKYLFYRGVGSFPLPVELNFTGPATLTISNKGNETIPHLLIYQRDRLTSATRFAVQSDLAGQAHTDIDLVELPEPNDASRKLYNTVASILEANGLYRQEAEAMIQTWWNSYFAAPGLRVFWIVPASLTESILPLSVTPAPSELVRVLVGRSEILEPEFERHLLAEATEDASLPRYFTDRYYSAYLSRVATLQGAPAPSDGEAVVEAGR